MLQAIDKGYAREEIIKLFGISRSTIKRYLKQRRETGTVERRPIPGRPRDAQRDEESGRNGLPFQEHASQYSRLRAISQGSRATQLNERIFYNPLLLNFSRVSRFFRHALKVILSN